MRVKISGEVIICSGIIIIRESVYIGPPFRQAYTSVKSLVERHTQTGIKVFIIRVKSVIRLYTNSHGPFSGRNHPTF